MCILQSIAYWLQYTHRICMHEEICFTPSCLRTLQHAEEPEIEPPALWSADDPLRFLSHRCTCELKSLVNLQKTNYHNYNNWLIAAAIYQAVMLKHNSSILLKTGWLAAVFQPSIDNTFNCMRGTKKRKKEKKRRFFQPIDFNLENESIDDLIIMMWE